MARESRLQTEIANYLRTKGAYVLVIQPQAGIPDACPDIIGLFDGGGWCALEAKAENPYKQNGEAKKGAFRPLQQITIRRLNNMYFSRAVWPENWLEIRSELDQIL